jgi:hypothetical protein
LSNFGIDVLTLVDFEQQVGGMADDVALGLGGEEKLAGAADPYGTALFARGDGCEAGARQPRPEASHADTTLRVEGWCALDGIDSVQHVLDQQVQFQLRRKLVLAALARDLDRYREGASAVALSNTALATSA